MSLALLNTMLLRDLSDPNLTAKGSVLTWEEVDQRIVIIANAIRELSQVEIAGLNPFDADTEYSNVAPDYVTYNGNTWEYVNAIPSTGVTPGTDPTTWALASTGAFVHAQNTDTKLDEGGDNEVTAAEIRDFIDAGPYDDTPVFYKDGSRVMTGDIDLDGNDLLNAGFVDAEFYKIDGDVVFTYHNSNGNLRIGATAYDVENGTDTIIIGDDAGNAGTALTAVTAVGKNAFVNLSTSASSAAFGARAGFSATTASYCMYFGPEAGYYNETGDHQICIGRNAGVPSGSTAISGITVIASGGCARSTGQFVAGSIDAPMHHVFFGYGQGSISAMPSTYAPVYLYPQGDPSDASADLDVSGCDFVFRNYRSVGDGDAGDLVFQYSPKVGTGTTYQTWTDALKINGNTGFIEASNNIGIGGTPVASLDIQKNISSPAWTTNGIGLRVRANTYTYNTGSGGTNFISLNSILGSTLNTTNAITINSYFTSLLIERPIPGSNLTAGSNQIFAQILTGNAGFLAGQAARFGTLDAHNLIFTTGALGRITLDQTGRQIHNASAQSSGTTPFITYTQANHTGGSQPGLLWTAGTLTGQTASTEVTDQNWNNSATLTLATGALATQRTVRFQGRTIAFAGASTITDLVNVEIDAPIAGTNATATNNYALRVNGNLGLLSTSEFYFGGASTDGTWRFVRSGNDLLIQRRESGSYVTKSTISA